MPYICISPSKNHLWHSRHTAGGLLRDISRSLRRASCLPAPGRLKRPLDVTSLLYHILWQPTQLRDKYNSINYLLSPAEKQFFELLQKVAAPRYSVFPKVRLADIVSPVSDLDRSIWQSAFNSIAEEHVDFVLCDSCNLAVLAVIELDDFSHKEGKQAKQDIFMDSVMAEAKIPIFHVPVKSSYRPSQLKQILTNLSLLPSQNQEGI